MYTSIEDKSHIFNQFTIDTEKGLQDLIGNLDGNPNLRFRGICEAKYNMLTSLQRKCPIIMKDRQKEYMTGLLHRVKCNSLVNNYFNNKKIDINDISCLALMQHHGLPTPLLDFSTDIRIALSFAADGVKTETEECETDKYVSLYVFDKAYEQELGNSIQQVLMNDMANGNHFIEYHNRQYPTESVNASILYNIDEFVKWDDIKDLELSYLEYQPLAPGVVTLCGQSLDLSNPNLIKQKGCFLLNLYSNTMSLEENWNGRTIESKNHFLKNMSSEFGHFPFKGVSTRKKMNCYDIKKEVIIKWAEKDSIPLYDNSQETTEIKKTLMDIYTGFDKEINNKQYL